MILGIVVSNAGSEIIIKWQLRGQILPRWTPHREPLNPGMQLQHGIPMADDSLIANHVDIHPEPRDHPF